MRQMRELAEASRTETGEAPPLVRSNAVLAGSAIGLGLAVLAGALWTALAFSDGHSTFFNHLPWWYGTAFIGAGLFGSLVAATFSKTRGPAAGLAHGATVAGVVVVIGAIAALAAAAVNGGETQVLINGVPRTVQLIRPYPAFVSALVTLGAGLLGGVVGGMIPRPLIARRVATTGAVQPDAVESTSRAA